MERKKLEKEIEKCPLKDNCSKNCKNPIKYEKCREYKIDLLKYTNLVLK